jgi:GxxExxY protein
MNEVGIIYPKLSYKIIGIAFRVFNEIGFGMNERYYQKAFAKELEKEKLFYEKEKIVKLNYKQQNIGNYFLDFVIENKIIVELKVKPKFGYVHIRQVLSYLKATGYKLAILIYFTRDGVKYKRIVNAK